jgi:hypothetical protein
MSRKSYLEVRPNLSKEMVGLLTIGMFEAQACDHLGISVSAHYKWMARGEREQKRLFTEEERLSKRKDSVPLERPNGEFIFAQTLESEAVYFQYFQSIKKAISDSHTLHLARIFEAAKQPKNWTASAWYLERRFPESYSNRDWRVIQKETQRNIHEFYSTIKNRLSPKARKEFELLMQDYLEKYALPLQE